MPEWIALSRSHHADAGYRPRAGYGFAARQPAVPVQLAELSRVLPHYMIAFTVEKGEYWPVVVLSVDGHTNLYVHDDGRWRCPYVPAALRGWPLALARNDKERVLCIDKSALTGPSEGEPLFDPDGEPSEPVAKTLEFLKQCEQGREATQKAAQGLAEAGVITPWQVSFERGEGQAPLSLEGLHRVDEKRLNALPDDVFAGFRHSGAAALAYAQLFSCTQSTHLAELARLQHQMVGQHQAAPIAPFLNEGDDELTFDFDR